MRISPSSLLLLAALAGCGGTAADPVPQAEATAERPPVRIVEPANGAAVSDVETSGLTLRATVRVRGTAAADAGVVVDSGCGVDCTVNTYANSAGAWATEVPVEAEADEPRAVIVATYPGDAEADGVRVIVTLAEDARRGAAGEARRGAALPTATPDGGAGAGGGGARGSGASGGGAGSRGGAALGGGGARGSGASGGGAGSRGGAAGGSATPPPAATAAPRARSGPRSLIVVGDSLAVGIEPLLPGLLSGWSVSIDARTGRPLAEGMQRLAALGSVARGTVLAFSLFTNDDPGAVAALTAAVRESATKADCVIWATIVRPPVGGRSYAAANAALERLAAGDLAGRLRLVPWADVIAANPHWLASDGVHATPDGYRARASLYAEAANACA